MTFGNAGATRTGLTFPFPFDEEFIELERIFTTLLADVDDNTEKNPQSNKLKQ
jgi:hypothetical protein